MKKKLEMSVHYGVRKRHRGAESQILWERNNAKELSAAALGQVSEFFYEISQITCTNPIPNQPYRKRKEGEKKEIEDRERERGILEAKIQKSFVQLVEEIVGLKKSSLSSTCLRVEGKRGRAREREGEICEGEFVREFTKVGPSKGSVHLLRASSQIFEGLGGVHFSEKRRFSAGFGWKQKEVRFSASFRRKRKESKVLCLTGKGKSSKGDRRSVVEQPRMSRRSDACNLFTSCEAKKLNNNDEKRQT
ncbi:hypothetical protein M5K25_005895 [Dendrobium thyrsiflorum]|uniref:Uncharacterized protein n=1 Tax=Dendrobium thyrsiflorum TaxID=117978 RepID=A0ABD0VHH2_DENTH